MIFRKYALTTSIWHSKIVNYLSFDMFSFVRQIRDEKEQILQISWENEEGAAKKAAALLG